jgi:hypothetical protein
MRVQGMAVSEMARGMGLDHKTVRRCLRQSQWQPYRRPPACQDAALGGHALARPARPRSVYAANATVGT